MKAAEFHDLKQGFMTVNQYIRKFTKLSRYAPKYVNTNKKKQDRFRRGLHSTLKTHLSASTYPDFNTMMNQAIIVEEVKTEGDNDRKRKFLAQKQKQ